MKYANTHNLIWILVILVLGGWSGVACVQEVEEIDVIEDSEEQDQEELEDTNRESPEDSVEETEDDTTFDFDPENCVERIIEGNIRIENDEELAEIVGVTVVTGDLSIEGVTTLNGLECLREVRELKIAGTYLTDLTGLNSLERINDSFYIGVNYELRSLAGIESLLFVSGTRMRIRNNPQLVELVAFNSELSAHVIITDNESLTNLAGLESIVHLDGVYLDFRTNPNLSDISNLSSLKSIKGLHFGGGQNLTNLTGLNVLEQVGEDGLRFGYIESLMPLESLRVVEGMLGMQGGDYSTMSSLENLEEVGSLVVVGSNLDSFEGLNSLRRINDSFTISQYRNLVNFEGLENLVTIGGDLIIAQNPRLENLSGLDSLTTIGGCLSIGESFEISIDEPCPECEESCHYYMRWYGNERNERLVSLHGLESLTEVGCISIRHNQNLDDLTGLNSLEVVHGNVKLYANLSMGVSGLDSLTHIEGDLRIGMPFLLDTDHPDSDWWYPCFPGGLSSLASLGQLIAVGGKLVIENTNISNFSGLEGLATLGGDLTIRGNYHLPQCEAVSFYQRLVNNGYSGTFVESENRGDNNCD